MVRRVQGGQKGLELRGFRVLGCHSLGLESEGCMVQGSQAACASPALRKDRLFHWSSTFRPDQDLAKVWEHLMGSPTATKVLLESRFCRHN